VEADDDLHNPDVRPDGPEDRKRVLLTGRGFINVGCIVVLCMALVVLL